MAKEDQIVYEYVQNFSTANRVLGIRKRNFWEGIIFSVITGWLIHFIPFVFRVQVIVTGFVCLSLFAFFAIGIHGRSVLEFVMLYVRYKLFKKQYHLRSVKYGKYKSPEKYDANGQRLSYAEQGLAFLRKFKDERIAEAKKSDKPKVKRVTTTHKKR